MSIPVGCSNAILNMVQSIENGGKPFPIFSSVEGCGSDFIWPQTEKTNIEQYLSGKPVTYHDTCPCGFSLGLRNDPFPDCAVKSCPLPIIKQMYVPKGIRIEMKTNRLQGILWNGSFFIVPPPDYERNSTFPSLNAPASFIEEFGAWSIDGKDINASFNRVTFGRSGPYRWRSAERDYSESAKVPCRQASLAQPTFNFSKAGKIQWGSVNCGSKIFPSFVPVKVDQTESAVWDWSNQLEKTLVEAGEIRITNQNWDRYNTGDETTVRRICSPWTVGDRVYGDALYPKLTAGNVYIRPYDDTEVRFSSTGMSTYAPNGPSCDQQRSILQRPMTYKPRQPNVISHSINQMNVSFSGKRSWQEAQARACIGIERFGFTGINIVRYQQGSPICDRIMEQFCINSAFIANPQYKKACGCILHQKRLIEKYGTLDIPVACFASQCANEDPSVYKTRRMSQGCSAKLCQQIIRIHGDGIKVQGNQTIECNGGVRTVIPTNSKIDDGTDETEPPLPEPVTFKIGNLFYTALIMLGVIIFLLILFFIRRYRLKKYYEKQFAVQNPV